MLLPLAIFFCYFWIHHILRLNYLMLLTNKSQYNAESTYEAPFIQLHFEFKQF